MVAVARGGGVWVGREGRAAMPVGRVVAGRARGHAAPRRGAGAQARWATGGPVAGAVGELVAGLPDQPEHRLAGVASRLADAAREQQAQTLGPSPVQLGGQRDLLAGDPDRPTA